MDVVLTPYTSKTKVVTDETGLWASIKKHDVGWFGIKPFASNSIFKGDSSPDSPHFEEDIAPFLKSDEAAARKDVAGGTSPARVTDAIKRAEAYLSALK